MFLFIYVNYLVGITMNKILYRLLDFILEAQNKFYQLKYKKPSKLVFSDSTTKTSMNSACTLKLTAITEENKAKVNTDAKEIIKKNIKTPGKLLDFVELKGTKVYKLPFADKILDFIGEEEGFITPLKGIKALYLNLMIGLLIDKKFKISFKTREMFVLRDLPVDIYIMSHQFHKWYGFKMKLPGYDYKTQEKFKKLFKNSNDKNIQECSLAEVISIKEAVARNVESIDFVVNLAKEYEGSKKSLEKIMTKNGANI